MTEITQEAANEEAELQRMIDEEEAAKADKSGKADKKKAVKTIPVKLNRAHWIGEERNEIGAIIDVEPAEARRLIDAGVASRTDPLPGE